ncbi:hypothetical protein C8R45DRAFT_1174060 [Mycena sanguinolenta]|nr:hypothetical protein C8R45DRAFT_1174060 [Mycena sanguinolenta]
MPFIESLPPFAEVAELLPLIGTIDPDPECIFAIFLDDVPRRMLAWLKEISSAPRDLINLWEDYGYMILFERTVRGGHQSAECIFPCSLEFLRVLASHEILQCHSLPELRGLLDLTWAEIRNSICGPSSNLTTDELGLAIRLAFRDVALQCIRKMVKNHLDIGGQVYSWETRDAVLESIHIMEIAQIVVNAKYKHIAEQHKLVDAISYLVRSSPPCDVLYRELWCIPTWVIRSSLISDISKCLESFPGPSMELIAFWKQAGRFNSKTVEIQDPKYTESRWRVMVNRWNGAIVRLRLPDTLELPYLLPEFVDFDVY